MCFLPKFLFFIIQVSAFILLVSSVQIWRIRWMPEKSRNRKFAAENNDFGPFLMILRPFQGPETRFFTILDSLDGERRKIPLRNTRMTRNGKEGV